MLCALYILDYSLLMRTKVRNVVAEYLFMETRLEVVKCGDWTRQSKELKGDVEGLREALGCR